MQKNKTRMLVEGAAMVALATILSFIKVFQLPWGGSITLLSMLPIVIYSIRWGVGPGFIVSFTYSLVQLLQGIIGGLFGWGLTPGMLVACIFLDYILAFSVLGIAGIFRKKKTAGALIGIVIAVVLRFIVHLSSGVIIWHSIGELWEGFYTENEFLYSFLYNGAYMLPELIITVIGAFVLLSVPSTKKLLLNTEASLNNSNPI